MSLPHHPPQVFRPPPLPLQPKATQPSAEPADNSKQSLLKRKFGRRVAALACAVRSHESQGIVSKASCLSRWREVARAIGMTETARSQLLELSKLMKAAAEGRANSHRAVRLAAVRRAVRGAEQHRMHTALRGWHATATSLALERLAMAHNVASTAAAAAASEVARMSADLRVAQQQASSRPVHLKGELRAEREALSRCEGQLADAEAKLTLQGRAREALESQVRQAAERHESLQRRHKAATNAARAAAVRRMLLLRGRWAAPRALWLWRAVTLGVAAASAVAALRGASSSSGQAARQGGPLRPPRSAWTGEEGEAAGGGGEIGTATDGAGRHRLAARLAFSSLAASRVRTRMLALHRWRGVAATLSALQAAAAVRGRGAEERRIARLRSEAEAARKKAVEERMEASDAAAAAQRALELERSKAASEVERCRRLAHRAAASLLSLGMGQVVRCARVLRLWRLNALRMQTDAKLAALSTALTHAKLEAPLPFSHAFACLHGLHVWRRAAEMLGAAKRAEEERTRSNHVARMLQGARAQLAQRTKLPLKLEEDLTAARTQLEGESARAKEALSANLGAQRSLEASKAQRDALESELRRTSKDLKAAQRELQRRDTLPRADAVVQAGGAAGDDEGSLQATAAAALAASAATREAAAARRAAAAAAPHRTAVLVRLMTGLPMSNPMKLASAIGEWRLWAQRRRGAAAKRGWRSVEAALRRCRQAEVRTLAIEIRCAEEAAAATASAMLHRVLDERKRRQTAEDKVKRIQTPLALQEEAKRIKEALELEVIARQAAEARGQRLQRQAAALDSQLRLANETNARLERERGRARDAGDAEQGGASANLASLVGAAARIGEGR